MKGPREHVPDAKAAVNTALEVHNLITSLV